MLVDTFEGMGICCSDRSRCSATSLQSLFFDWIRNIMFTENTLVFDNNTDNLVSSVDDSEAKEDSLPRLLPRASWNSQVAYLRVLFRAKKALDRIEKEAGVLKS